MAWPKRFGIMLCQPLDERKLERNLKEAGYLLVQPKLDGMRCWVDYDSKGEPHLISSEGNIITGVPHITLLMKDVKKHLRKKINFDGELYSHQLPFEEIVGICKRKSTNIAEDFTQVEYHIFDYKSDEPNQLRDDNLVQWLGGLPESIRATGSLVKVQTNLATSIPSVMTWLEDFIRLGYEGIIVRNPLVPYVERRPRTILKFKPTKEDIYDVVELVEAISEEGRPLGRVGAVVCQDRFGNEFSVGTGIGITIEKAKDIWQNRDKWIGSGVKVQYQNLTQNGVPRFGKFISFTNEKENHNG